MAVNEAGVFRCPHSERRFRSYHEMLAFCKLFHRGWEVEEIDGARVI